MEQISLASIVEFELPASEDLTKAEKRRRRFRRNKPVLDPEDQPEQLALVFKVKKRRGRPKGSLAEPNHNDFTWSDEAIRLVMDGLLHQTRKAFDPDTSESERDSILYWVAEPLDSPSMNPFSFAACCEAFGLDPETLQMALLYHAERGLEAEEESQGEAYESA